jgi:hypothetical protein
MQQAAQGRAWTIHDASPRSDTFGVHHSKAFVAEFEAGLRLIVHTSNLIHQVHR